MLIKITRNNILNEYSSYVNYSKNMKNHSGNKNGNRYKHMEISISSKHFRNRRNFKTSFFR